MFQSAWTRHRPTPQVYTPIVQEVQPEVIVPKVSVEPRVESHQIMGKEVPSSWVVGIDQANGIDTTAIVEHKPDGTMVVQSITQEHTPVIEPPVGTDINVATTGPVEVDLSTPIVIAETRHIDIDSGEVVAQSDIVALDDGIHSIPHEDIYDEVVDSTNTTLRDLGNATTESAYTYGIQKLRNLKKDRPDDWIVGHIFGGSYDLWITEYNESERIYFGFASFGGLFDQDAEWGYVSIDEILGLGFPKPERDFYWTPCTLQSLKDAEQKAYDQKEQAIQLGADVDEDEEHPRVAEIKQEVIDNEVPFKQEAELPPIKSYRKYEILPRPTERKDRIFGNLIEEHGENLASLYQQFS